MTNHIGYKKIRNDFIVKLEILSDGLNNEGRIGINPENAKYAKNRCSKAKVLDIYNIDTGEKKLKGRSNFEYNFVYKVGKTIEVKNYDTNVNKICGNGIHYFLSEERAYYWEKNIDWYSGEYKTWDDNGNILTQQFYKNGLQSGISKEWYINGQLYGLLDGLRHVWGDNGHILIQEEFYKNGVFDGLRQMWHNNGNISVMEFYKNGVFDGLRQMWHNNGNILVNEFYKNGLLEGLRQEWDNNGNILVNEFYKNGLLDGLRQEWDNNGNILVKEFYKNGVLDGLIQKCKLYGERYSRCFYKNGHLSQKLRRSGVQRRSRKIRR